MPAYCRPSDITLPQGWTWDRVEAERLKWGIAANMIPIATAPGVVAWGTISSVRMGRDAQGYDRVIGATRRSLGK